MRGVLSVLEPRSTYLNKKLLGKRVESGGIIPLSTILFLSPSPNPFAFGETDDPDSREGLGNLDFIGLLPLVLLPKK